MQFLPSGCNQTNATLREIVDESDVYVDVHKAIRRLNPAPRAKRINEAAALAAAATVTSKKGDGSVLVDIAEDGTGQSITVGSLGAMSDTGITEDRPRTAIFMKRRSSEGPDGQRSEGNPVPIKASLDEMKQQLRLGPANRAAKPLSNKRDVFKIKQGLSPHQPTTEHHGCSSRMPPRSVTASAAPPSRTQSGDERTPLLAGERRESGDWDNKANGSKNDSSERS
jgi:metal transporter CNNM